MFNDVSLNGAASDLLATVRRELLRLADLEDHVASTEAARVPYWSAYPESVLGHRVAARVLRQNADRFLSPAQTAVSG
jgi:hypothetical protein